MLQEILKEWPSQKGNLILKEDIHQILHISQKKHADEATSLWW